MSHDHHETSVVANAETSVIADELWRLLSRIHALIVLDGRPHSGHYASFGPGDLSTDPTSGDEYFSSQ